MGYGYMLAGQFMPAIQRMYSADVLAGTIQKPRGYSQALTSNLMYGARTQSGSTICPA